MNLFSLSKNAQAVNFRIFEWPPHLSISAFFFAERHSLSWLHFALATHSIPKPILGQSPLLFHKVWGRQLWVWQVCVSTRTGRIQRLFNYCAWATFSALWAETRYSTWKAFSKAEQTFPTKLLDPPPTKETWLSISSNLQDQDQATSNSFFSLPLIFLIHTTKRWP